MNIGFIGLGNMGSGMALNILKAGYTLTVYDVKQELIIPIQEAGAFQANNPKAVAQESEIVFTSLPGPVEVEAVALGEGGLIEGLRPGMVYIDLSSSSPTLARRIYDRFKEKGASVMDIPVSGGVTGAKSGKLTMMVGGDEDVFQKCFPVLKSFGDKITYTGKIGCGSICKLMHNCIGYGLQTIVAECLTLGVKAGVEPMALWRILRDGGTGQGVMFHRVMPDIVLRGHFDPPHFALRLAFKDVNLATSLGREFEVPMPMANLALQEMMSALNRGWGDRDSRVTMLLQEERAGNIEVRIPEAQLNEELIKSDR
jgi:3-hydroxyisobutyrate dehydrogenase-like beta-hydroxyacid dehydrogenase